MDLNYLIDADNGDFFENVCTSRGLAYKVLVEGKSAKDHGSAKSGKKRAGRR